MKLAALAIVASLVFSRAAAAAPINYVLTGTFDTVNFRTVPTDLDHSMIVRSILDGP
jgi:hypothetical protein